MIGSSHANNRTKIWFCLSYWSWYKYLSPSVWTNILVSVDHMMEVNQQWRLVRVEAEYASNYNKLVLYSGKVCQEVWWIWQIISDSTNLNHLTINNFLVGLLIHQIFHQMLEKSKYDCQSENPPSSHFPLFWEIATIFKIQFKKSALPW